MVSITIPRSGMDVPVVRPLFFESLRSPRLVRLAWSGDPGLVGAARSPCRGNLSASPRARASSRHRRQARLALALRARSRAATSTGPLVAAARRFLPAPCRRRPPSRSYVCTRRGMSVAWPFRSPRLPRRGTLSRSRSWWDPRSPCSLNFRGRAVSLTLAERGLDSDGAGRRSARLAALLLDLGSRRAAARPGARSEGGPRWDGLAADLGRGRLPERRGGSPAGDHLLAGAGLPGLRGGRGR